MSIGSGGRLILYDPNDGMKNSYLPINDSTFVETNDASEISFATDIQTGQVKSMDFSGAFTFYKIR
ncbi:hypothetical protein FRZ59_12460 [Anseongella ginsenosidimutans]|nr:hypothetical protein FRZ59_12460 [Anseongella ginsenosidimutans]